MTKNTSERIVYAVVLLMAAIGVCACQAVPAEPLKPLLSTIVFGSPVPVPTLATLTSVVATPTIPRADAQGELKMSPLPRPPSGGTVSGMLLVGVNAPVPARGAILYLGNVYFDAKGIPLAGGFEKQTAPRTQSDESGGFVFSDVTDGTYVLIFDRGYEAFLLNHPTTGKDMLIKISEGRSVDLGNLIYRTIPGEDLAR